MMEQMVIDLWPKEAKSERDEVVDDFMRWACESHGCGDDLVPYVERLYDEFGRFGVWERGKALLRLSGTHQVDGYTLDDVDMLGIYDASLDYHTIWDRGWAAYAGVDKSFVSLIEYCEYNNRSPKFFDRYGKVVAIGTIG